MNRPNRTINVTQPCLPELDLFVKSLQDIWEQKWLTNNGKYHQKFEQQLQSYLGVNECSLLSNGTLALLIGLRALDISGQVITTPFSFVATSHSILWNGLTPVFCDIEPHTYNMDPNKIERLITPETSAIMPVHVYGNPCDMASIDTIAKNYGLKVIYDAAHAFGVTYNGESLLQAGDLSILSFHATKVFNTIEGGAIVAASPHIKAAVDSLRNFGFKDETTVEGVGINAKMNELQAAYGLLQLTTIEKEIRKRKHISDLYREKLSTIRGLRLPEQNPAVQHNYSYFPIEVDEKSAGFSRDVLYSTLKHHNINSRRYFFPLISNFKPYHMLPSAAKASLPVANKAASQILCLPIYGALSSDEVEIICNHIQEVARLKEN